MLAIEVGASLRAQDVILTLSRLMRIYGKPAFVRSDNGAEFTRHHQLASQLGIHTYFCDPRAPWQKGGIENAAVAAIAAMEKESEKYPTVISVKLTSDDLHVD